MNSLWCRFSSTLNRVCAILVVPIGIFFLVLICVKLGSFSLNKNWENQPDYHEKILSEPYWSDQIGEDAPEVKEYEKQSPRRPKKE